jgi:hypothetical protein
MARLPDLTQKQEAAINELEKAFLACKRANLAFFIMEGNSIFAFNATEIDEYLLNGLHDMGTATQDFENFSDVTIPRHYGTIRDCGGF